MTSVVYYPPDINKNYELDIIQELVHVFIDKYVMQSITEELKQAVRLIAPIRRFDVDLLGQFIDKFSLPYEGGFGVLTLRGDMINSHLVEYDEHRKAQAMDPTVRRILTLFMRHFAPERYREVNEFAFQFNTRRLQQSSGTDITLFMIERLYHRANLLALENKSPKKTGELLRQDLFDLEREVTLVDTQQLQAELEKDWELEEVLDRGFNLIIA